MSEIRLNSDQEKVVNKIKEKIQENKGGFITISGGAGTGKTFSVKYAIEDIIEDSFIAITPSHKACSVLSDSIGKQAVTLASALGIRLNEFNGSFRPDPMAKKMIKNKKYVLIDEVSMVSRELLKEIEREVMDKCIVIMMGDINQLPPVGSNEPSPAFSDYETVYLKEIMRQSKESDIAPFLSNLVGAIEDKNDFSLDKINKKDSDVEYKLSVEDFIKSFVKDSKKDAKGTRVMTYNNEKSQNYLGVKFLNESIINKMFGSFELIENFQLMAYSGFNHDPKERSPSISNFKITNSVDYSVVSAGPKRMSTRDVKSYIKDPRDGNRGVKITPVSIEMQKVTLSSNCEDYVFDCEIPTLSTKGVGKLQEIVNLAFNAKEYQFGYKLMEKFPYLLPGYVCSSHKSQGSTYTNAYVAYENIISQGKVPYKDKLKSIYVAASRASKKLVIF